MSTIVDIILIAFIILGAYAGSKKGLIKTAVGFVGLVTIIIISYTLKSYLANFLIDVMPFFPFGGELEGLTALNILIYNVISFVVIFVLMYCVLNIVLALTGFIDTLLKFTVIWIIPSKIGGAILGLFEAWLFIFLAVFVLGQFSFANGIISNSKVSSFMLDHTPVIGTYLSGATQATKEIYEGIEEYRNDETKTTNDLNLYILQVEINYGLVSKEKATELMEIGKIGIDGVMFGKEQGSWLNI